MARSSNKLFDAMSSEQRSSGISTTLGSGRYLPNDTFPTMVPPIDTVPGPLRVHHIRPEDASFLEAERVSDSPSIPRISSESHGLVTRE